jgi:DMSO/TMAO reductase YedYZ molybdopterin-dependent catalytic subunit
MAESRVELLTDEVTPSSHHYVTGSAPPPRAVSANISGWKLQVDGEVATPRNFSMADLQALPHVTRRYVTRNVASAQQGGGRGVGGEILFSRLHP